LTVFWEGLDWLLAVLAMAGVAYNLVAAFASLRFFARPPTTGGSYPALSILKPLHGDHQGLADALARFCRQDYPGEVQIVFGVHHAEDAAVAVVERLRADMPEADISLVIDPRLHGANRKASNLINIAEHARHDLLIISDADIVVESDYLRRVVAAMGEPGIGAVSCLYVGQSNGSLWARLSAMGIDYQFLPSVLMGRALGLAEPCFGATIAIAKGVLDEIGGFAAFADHLADDYEIGRAVRARGYHIAIPTLVVAHHCAETSGRELIGHQLRWNRTVRLIDPWGFAGSLITYPTALALLAAAAAGFPLWSGALILASLGSRLCLKACVDAATGARAGPWWLMPILDIMSFAVFLASFAVNTVGWQGRRFRVGPDGVLFHSSSRG
jgi:ceramide glucosyltransferase